MDEQRAANVFRIAIANGQCLELLQTLFEGGGFTLEMDRLSPPRLVMLPPELIKAALDENQ